MGQKYSAIIYPDDYKTNENIYKSIATHIKYTKINYPLQSPAFYQNKLKSCVDDMKNDVNETNYPNQELIYVYIDTYYLLFKDYLETGIINNEIENIIELY
jgi:hypothetical protein